MNRLNRTKPDEFIKFHQLLMSNAPVGYTPWYFPVIRNNKAPDGIAISKRVSKEHQGRSGNWKADWALLTFNEAVDRLNKGDNVGIAARENDPLVIIDIDSWKYTSQAPETLTNMSRKRCAIHCFCFAKDNSVKINIPTDDGEIRASEQYVVAPGSFCTTSEIDIDKEEITDEHKHIIKKDWLLGTYTVFSSTQPKYISFEDFPQFFKDKYNEVKEIEAKNILTKPTAPILSTGKHSALFDLQIEQLVSCNRNSRVPHPLHASDTGMNFSVTNGLAHCWRHNVSLNALQFLVVKSGYMSCEDAGTGHTKSGAGSSRIINNGEALYNAWMEAKECGYIPKDDPIPTKAMIYLAKKLQLIPDNYNKELLPTKVYNLVIKQMRDV